jgi:flagellar assembly factor FliW
MKTGLFSLPNDIFCFMSNYLLATTEQNKQIFQFSHDWRNFTNTSKTHFADVKKRCILIVLALPYTQKFRKSSSFRDRVLQLIINPLEQLELRFLSSFEQYGPTRINFVSFPALKKLVLQNYQFLQHLPALHELSLVSCNANGLQISTPLNKLEVFETPMIDTVTLDASCLNILEEASFSFVELDNYQHLSHLRSLHIEGIDAITDVSCFQNISRLEIYGCRNVTDVSPLGNVQKLELMDCQGITDVSALGGVYDLNLSFCFNVYDVSALGNVHILNLTCCYQVTDLSRLTNVYEFHFAEFQGDTITGLENTEKLVLEEADDISDITMLQKLKELDVSRCEKITHFQGLDNLTKLTISGNQFKAEGGDYNEEDDSFFKVDSGLKVFNNLKELRALGVIFTSEEYESVNFPSFLSLDHLKNVEILSLEMCTISPIPETFTRLRSLHLKSCIGLEQLGALPALGDLVIASCRDVEKLTLAGEDLKYPIYSVEISHCSSLTELLVTRKIFRMKIMNCCNLSHMKVKNRIDYLKTKSCPKLNISGSDRIVCRQNYM